jgi:hypothetical protein
MPRNIGAVLIGRTLASGMRRFLCMILISLSLGSGSDAVDDVASASAPEGTNSPCNLAEIGTLSGAAVTLLDRYPLP